MKQFIVLMVISTVTFIWFQFMYDDTYDKWFNQWYGNWYNDWVCLMVFKMMPDKKSCSAKETDSGTLIFVK